MVSAVEYDAVRDPTSAIQALPQDESDFPVRVAAHFSEIFASPDAFADIPLLDVRNPPESFKNTRSLVRFRAMVQDTSVSPQMYLANAGWGIIDEKEPIDYADFRECTVVWAVSIPGESFWDASEDNVRAYKATSVHPHKFPIPDAAHLGVQVKIYDNSSADAMKSTDIHDFVGILSSEPWHSSLDSDDSIMVPTLHVVFSRPLGPTIVHRTYPQPAAVAELRKELISWIATEALAGDEDAAEWVLLTCIARVQSRNPPILPPSLIISQFPTAGGSPTLSAVLSQIFPLLSTLPLSLDTINKTSFAPESKDEDLHSGWLQMPKGSVCVITEGGVREGTVNERGVINLQTVQNMMSSQSLDYVFPFSRYSFRTDVSFVVICEGRKSAFFQTTVNVPLRPKGSSSETVYKASDQISLPTPEKLQLFREFVGGSKVGNVSIGEETGQYIQDDFVNERKEANASGKPTVTSDDLIHRMTMARLLALSFHETEVNTAIWEKIKALESRRQGRLK
ncbi:putative alanine racemase-domain-containing protein [Mycena floridula]|nr:putative alanine racemase-domain-containing protein [Mycena floridula]